MAVGFQGPLAPIWHTVGLGAPHCTWGAARVNLGPGASTTHLIVTPIGSRDTPQETVLCPIPALASLFRARVWRCEAWTSGRGSQGVTQDQTGLGEAWGESAQSRGLRTAAEVGWGRAGGCPGRVWKGPISQMAAVTIWKQLTGSLITTLHPPPGSVLWGRRRVAVSAPPQGAP